MPASQTGLPVEALTTANRLSARHLGYDLLRITSICAVVAIHTFGPMAANSEIRFTGSWVVAVLFSTGAIWSVPVFVMLAGALSLTERAHSGGPLRFYLKRAKRILPALIAWHLIYLVGIRMILLRQDFSRSQLVEAFIDMSIYPHLYFLWLIAGLYLFAPVLAAFLHQGGQRRALVLAACTLGATLLVYMIPRVLSLFGIDQPLHFEFLTIWLPYVGYFVAGYALAHAAITRKLFIWCSVGVVTLGLFVMAQFAFPAELRVARAIATPEYLGLGVALLSICVFVTGTYALGRVRLPQRVARWIVTISEASFGVYLVHLIVLLVPHHFLTGFSGAHSIGQSVLAYVSIVIISFTISILARKIPGVRLIF